MDAGPSAACRAVSFALNSLGMQHECHTLSPDGGQVADILLPQHSIALLVEGRSGYLINTGQRNGVQLVAGWSFAMHISTRVPCRWQCQHGQAVQGSRLGACLYL